MTCWAPLDIKSREQLTGALCSEVFYMPAAERKEGLPRLNRPFVCQCTLFTSLSSERLVSDLERYLMRHLYTALRGHDPASTPTMLNTKVVRQRTFAQSAFGKPYARDTITYYPLPHSPILETLLSSMTRLVTNTVAAGFLIDLQKTEGLYCACCSQLPGLGWSPRGVEQCGEQEHVRGVPAGAW